jgi:hypothetical protein
MALARLTEKLRGLSDVERWRPYFTRRYWTLYVGILTLLVSGTLYGLSAYTPALKGSLLTREIAAVAPASAFSPVLL